MTALTASDLEPNLTVAEPPRRTRAVALVLPGGKARSEDPTSPRQLAALRMRPFAHRLRSADKSRCLAVWTLRYRVRGWNAPAASPTKDAGWALDQIRRRHGDVPVVLVGHSMGGRTALRVAGDPSVCGVVALAPWIENDDPVRQLEGRSLLIAHGDLDVVTSPRASLRFARAAAEVADPFARVAIRDNHAMVLHWRLWHQLAAEWSFAALGLAPLSTRLQRAVDAARAGDLALRL